MNHLFIFPEAVQTEDTIALDLEGNRLSFSCSNKLVAINLDALRSGFSTVIQKNPVTGSVYPLFNFREILQVMDLGPQELLRTLGLCSFVQIDKSGKDIFMKVFLPKGQPELRSRTHDFSRFPHVVMADLCLLEGAGLCEPRRPDPGADPRGELVFLCLESYGRRVLRPSMRTVQRAGPPCFGRPAVMERR